MLATKLDDSSLISRSHMVKKENQLLHVILQVCCGMCSPTHAPTQNKCSKRRKKNQGGYLPHKRAHTLQPRQQQQHKPYFSWP